MDGTSHLLGELLRAEDLEELCDSVRDVSEDLESPCEDRALPRLRLRLLLGVELLDGSLLAFGLNHLLLGAFALVFLLLALFLLAFGDDSLLLLVFLDALPAGQVILLFRFLAGTHLEKCNRSARELKGD